MDTIPKGRRVQETAATEEPSEDFRRISLTSDPPELRKPPMTDTLLEEDKYSSLDGGNKNQNLDRLFGVVVDAQYQIGNLIRRENHSDVYETTRIQDSSTLSSSSRDIEARVFTFFGENKKLASYRRRNIGRLSNRTIWKGDITGKTVVIYRTSNEVHKQIRGEKDHTDAHPEHQHVNQITPISDDDMKEFAGNVEKRETARLKQQRRRVRQREEARSLGEDFGDYSFVKNAAASDTPQYQGMIYTLATLYSFKKLRDSFNCGELDSIRRTSLLARDSIRRINLLSLNSINRCYDSLGAGRTLNLPRYLFDDPLDGLTFTSMEEIDALYKAKMEEEESLMKLYSWMSKNLSNRTFKACIGLCKIATVAGFIDKTPYVDRGNSGCERQDLGFALKPCLELPELLDFLRERARNAKSCYDRLSSKPEEVNPSRLRWTIFRADIGNADSLQIPQPGMETTLGALIPHTGRWKELRGSIEPCACGWRG